MLRPSGSGARHHRRAHRDPWQPRVDHERLDGDHLLRAGGLLRQRRRQPDPPRGGGGPDGGLHVVGSIIAVNLLLAEGVRPSASPWAWFGRAPRSCRHGGADGLSPPHDWNPARQPRHAGRPEDPGGAPVPRGVPHGSTGARHPDRRPDAAAPRHHPPHPAPQERPRLPAGLGRGAGVPAALPQPGPQTRCSSAWGSAPCCLGDALRPPRPRQRPDQAPE